MSRAPLLLALLGLLVAAALLTTSCQREDPVFVIGRKGLGDGEFDQPRAVAVSDHGIAVIDRSGRLQVFELDGAFRAAFPVILEGSIRGFPIGVTWLPDGKLAVSDTHRGRLMVYDAAGEVVQVIGEYGAMPGQLLLPQRMSIAPGGNYVISDHGLIAANRIQVFTPQGEFVRRFGGSKPEQGGMARPLGVVARDDGSFVVADQRAGVLRYAPDGTFAERLPLGEQSSLFYGLAQGDGGRLYVSDLDGDRIIRLAADGTPDGVFGATGRERGEFLEPWDVAWHGGYLYVADRMNHRVQRLDAARLAWSAP